MTVTEIARYSDSLFYDQISRRDLCDRIANDANRLESMGNVCREMLWCMTLGYWSDEAPNPHQFEKQLRKLGIEVPHES